MLNATILIVDESHAARALAMAAIRAFDPTWRWVVAGDADEALRHMEEGYIDGAFVNYDLPLRSGLSLAAELLSVDPTVPIALSVSNPPAEALEGAKELGLLVIPRPISPVALSLFFRNTAFWARIRQT